MITIRDKSDCVCEGALYRKITITPEKIIVTELCHKCGYNPVHVYKNIQTTHGMVFR